MSTLLNNKISQLYNKIEVFTYNKNAENYMKIIESMFYIEKDLINLKLNDKIKCNINMNKLDYIIENYKQEYKNATWSMEIDPDLYMQSIKNYIKKLCDFVKTYISPIHIQTIELLEGLIKCC